MYSQPSSSEQTGRHEFKPAQAKRWHQQWWGRLLLVLLFIFSVSAVATGIFFYQVTRLYQSGDFENIPSKTVQQPVHLPQLNPEFTRAIATKDDPGVGPHDAKVTVVEFGDFECPACGQEYLVVKSLIDRYRDRVRFIYRDFPLVSVHPQSVQAALAAECAHEQGKFWEMHDKLFENQAALTEADFEKYAIQIGLNSLEFNNCWESQRYIDEIEEDLHVGISVGVEATPTFFINGQKISGALPLDKFEQLIVAELNK